MVFLLTSSLGALPEAGRFTPTALYEPASAFALGEQLEEVIVPLLAQLVFVAAALALAGFSFRRQTL